MTKLFAARSRRQLHFVIQPDSIGAGTIKREGASSVVHDHME